MKYYIIAGEASGDLHGSNLLREIKKIDCDFDFRCWGGDLMQLQGAKIVKHYKDLAFMGFTEVLMNLRTIFKNIDWCKQDILEYKPDVLILVDYPGFNLRIAEFAKQNGIKVVYYISPQVWAWKQSRVYKIKKVVDRMLTILPFEKDFYKQFNYNVDFVGHPLIDAIASFEIEKKKTFSDFTSEHKLNEKPIIALLPGSRSQEIKTMLPVMIDAAEKFNDYQIVIAAAPSQPVTFYKSITGSRKIGIVQSQTYHLLSHASSALVTSGTATLETALFNVPQVVCYKGGKISYFIARQLIKVKYISLVNLIMNAPVVTELIQDDMSANRVGSELEKIIISDGANRLRNQYHILKTKLGGTGASAKAASIVVKTANGK
jgi:lipid-A-disaccharide synthase